MAYKKDSVDLICSIGELAGMFERSTSLSDFLGTVVSVVAYHMNAAVCSIYLSDDETGELVLRANQGLNPDYIGKLRLKTGQGLVGMALKQLRPINAGQAPNNPNYAFIPGLHEEQYQSLLAVPILRGLNRVGVLVVQDPQRDYFTDHDVKALQAIAAQLATTIENAKLLMNLYREPEEQARKALPSFFKGVGVSNGRVLAKANILGRLDAFLQLTQEAGGMRVAAENSDAEDFHAALTRSMEQLEEIQNKFEEDHGDLASLIFSAQLLMLKDSQFSGAMVGRIKNGLRPAEAVVQVVNEYVQLFSGSKNVRLQEKAQDVKDLGHRILLNLGHGQVKEADYEGEILVTGELLPSDIVKFCAERASGLIMVGGGSSSHVSILARSMDLPMVVLSDPRAFELPPGTPLLIDAEHGNVVVNPGADVVRSHREYLEAEKEAALWEKDLLPETRTACGERVELLANINLLSELNVAVRLKAEGVGLYRSEFPFIVRSEFPSEEEQFRIYRTVLERMEGKPVTLRTLDVGGDKMLSYFPSVTQVNPFLGLRAIRFTLQHRHIFEDQLRAMLRAGVDADLRIMFPMISSLDDYQQAVDILRQCAQDLAARGVPHLAAPKIGAMIETPSAIEIADELAEAADFLCVGTNDLVQYILAVDRTNESVSHMYLPYHPSVLRSLKRIVDAANRHRTPLSVCGEMAVNESMLSYLLGIGFRTISMDARMIPRVQTAIRNLRIEQARNMAERMLTLSRISDVETLLGETKAAS